MTALIFLYIISFGYGNYPHVSRVQMPDMVVCQQTIEKSKSVVSQGDESESALVMFCGGDDYQKLTEYTDNTHKWSVKK